MNNQFGKWWPLWVALSALWTFVVFAAGWINLPRAQDVPHDSAFLGQLSDEASSILFPVSVAQEKGARSALVWTQNPRTVRMMNGADLEFPAVTTGGQAALVAAEYRDFLNSKAQEQRWPYLMALLAIWIVPCASLLAAASAIRGNGRFNYWAGLKIVPRYVRQRTEFVVVCGNNGSNDEVREKFATSIYLHQLGT